MSLAGLKIDATKLEHLTPEERVAVVADLKVLEEAFKANPLLAYRPHPKQHIFHKAEPGAIVRWPASRLFLGGNRSGKTTATMVDTMLQAIDLELVPEHLAPYRRWGEPPFYARVVTPDLTNTLEGVVLQKFRDWLPKSQLVGNGFDRSWDKVARVLRFKNGSWIQFFSNDQDLDKFGGAALHRVVYDEEPRQDIRRECLMRLIDFGGEELFGMTPLQGMSWVFDEFYDPWERGVAGQDVRIVVVDMDDNPHLDKLTMHRVLKGLTPQERQARKSGRFVSFAGLIYPEWSERETLMLPEPEEIPKDAEIFCAIDPGYRFLAVVLYAYLTADDDLVIFDEIAIEQARVSDICKEIRIRNERWSINPRWYVIDPAARNRNTQTGRSDQAEFSDHGIHTIPGQNAVMAGINHVKERIEAEKLKVTANCFELRAEFKRYRWIKNTNRSENAPPERPVKKDDHALDALRYMVMARPLAPPRDTPSPTDTWKDRLLRESLKSLRRLGRHSAPIDHFAGPGIFD
jgi:phage terminase large subunit-like protein